MIIRIAARDVKVGMYIESMEGGWINNPFWRSSFLVKSEAELEKLAASAIDHVTIDTTKGRGLATVRDAGPSAASAVPAAATTAHARRPARPRPRGASPAEALRQSIERSKQRVIALFDDVRVGRVIDIGAVSPVVDDIAAALHRDPAAFVTMTRLKDNDEYTYLHSVAVCALMINLALHLGLPDEEVHAVGAAGLLHDIGKVAMPADILDKPGTLGDDEWHVMRRHPSEGHALLNRQPGTPAITLDVCLHHHERLDGSGYPEGLKDDQVSLHARIAAICDVYDAVTSIRPYKRPWSAQEALARMLDWSGHFDPVLLDAFITMLGVAPLGALVRLHSNRLGVVVAAGAEPKTPVVRVFFHVEQTAALPPEDVDTAGDPILRRERGDYWFGESWPAMRAELRKGEAPPTPDGFIPAPQGEDCSAA